MDANQLSKTTALQTEPKRIETVMLKSKLRRTALAALVALVPSVSFALEREVVFPPEAVGLEAHWKRTLSFRDAQGDFALVLSSVRLRQENDRLVGTLTANLPNFLREANRLGNPSDFRVKSDLFFRHLRVENLWTHVDDPTILTLRANVAMRVITHPFGVRISNRFSKNVSIPLDLLLSDDGTVISVFAHLREKRGFPGAIEAPARRMIESLSRSWRLSPELVSYGVRIDTIAFAGTAKGDDLAVILSVSLPTNRLPDILTGNAPKPDTVLVPTQNPPRPSLPSDTATSEALASAQPLVPRDGYAAPGGGYWAPLDRFGGAGPMVFHHEP